MKKEVSDGLLAMGPELLAEDLVPSSFFSVEAKTSLLRLRIAFCLNASKMKI